MENFTHKKVLSANRQYYDKIGEAYRANEIYAYSEAMIADVTKNLKYLSSLIDERKYFLDFGCGNGFLSEIIFENKLFESTVGVDISKTQVGIYNKKFNNPKFRAFIGDITNLPYDANSFNMAGCYSVLHHIIDYKAVISEISRVLKPGGALYIDFEPSKSFRKIMSLPIKIRRKTIDKAPEKLEQIEYISEYHHNIEQGIDKDYFIKWIGNDYDIIDVQPKFPDLFSKPILKLLFKFSWSFAPYFCLLMRKK